MKVDDQRDLQEAVAVIRRTAGITSTLARGGGALILRVSIAYAEGSKCSFCVKQIRKTENIVVHVSYSHCIARDAAMAMCITAGSGLRREELFIVTTRARLSLWI